MAGVRVEWCVSGRELTEPRLSPDGRLLGVAVSAAGELGLVVHDLDDGQRRPLTDVPAPRVGRGFGGGCWCWSIDGDAVVYAAVDGDLWWQPLHGTAHTLTEHGPERIAQAPVMSADGSFVAYVLDQAEVWCVWLDDGRSERLDNASADFCFDPAPFPDSSGVMWQAWNVPDMPWDGARRQSMHFGRGVEPDLVVVGALQQPRAMPDGATVSVRDDHGHANIWLDARRGPAALVDEPFEHAEPSWGLGQRSFASSPDGRRIAFTRNEGGFGRLCVVDVASRAVHEVARGVHGQLSWAGDRVAALRSGGRTPTQVVVYEGAGLPPWPRRVVDVGPSVEWGDAHLVEPELIEARAADGTTVHARLYRADDREGVADQRLICWLHGGPTDQWQVRFMPRIAFWRSLGWNILVPDHRGSTGHGRAYQQALRGRWGELDVTDTVDMITHAQESAWGAPATTVLMGSSAGGFTVLGVVASAPDLVAAAVVVYPVSDLVDLAERSHRFERHYTTSLVGQPPVPGSFDESHRYHQRSPVWFADRIRTPLLVFHGEDDPVVPVAQSRVLVERVRAAGGDAELCEYPDEGHGFRDREHQLDEYRRTEAFLRRHVP